MRNLTNLRFADDVLPIGKSTAEVHQMLKDLKKEASLYGLEMNLGKTKVLWNGVGERAPAPTLDVEGQEVEILDSSSATMYLGKSLCLTDVHDTELRHRTAKDWAKFTVYKDELCSKKYELKHRLKLYNAVKTPTLLYGYESWTIVYQRQKRNMERSASER